jgi:anti-anti-sigma factor
MSLVLQERNIGPITLLELSERLTLEHVPELRRKVEELAAQGRRSLLLDCSRITVVDSRGIGGLMRDWISLRNQGGKLKLLNPSARLRELLKIVGLHKIFESFDDIGAALHSF